MADNGSMEFGALDGKLPQLASTGGYVRAMARRVDNGWALHHMAAVLGFTPPEWRDEVWQYEELAFVACRVETSALAGVVRPGTDWWQ